MSANAWAVVVIDTDLTTPPIKYFEIGTSFATLVAELLIYLEERIFPVASDEEDLSLQERETRANHEKELQAFRANIDKLRSGGYMMSINGTICVEVKPLQTTLQCTKYSRKAIELSDVVDREEKRARTAE